MNSDPELTTLTQTSGPSTSSTIPSAEPASRSIPAESDVSHLSVSAKISLFKEPATQQQTTTTKQPLTRAAAPAAFLAKQQLFEKVLDISSMRPRVQQESISMPEKAPSIPPRSRQASISTPEKGLDVSSMQPRGQQESIATAAIKPPAQDANEPNMSLGQAASSSQTEEDDLPIRRQLGGLLREFRKVECDLSEKANTIVAQLKALQTWHMLPSTKRTHKEAIRYYSSVAWGGDLLVHQIPDALMTEGAPQAVTPMHAHQIFVQINARAVSYHLCLKPPSLNTEEIKHGYIYLEKTTDKLNYIVITPAGQLVQDVLNIHIPGDLTEAKLLEYQHDILKATSEKGHTDAAFFLRSQSYLWVTTHLSEITQLFDATDTHIQRLLPEPSVHKRVAALQLLIKDVIKAITASADIADIQKEMKQQGASSYLRKLERLALSVQQLVHIAAEFKKAQIKEESTLVVQVSFEQTLPRHTETEAERARTIAMAKLISGAANTDDLAMLLSYATCLKYLRTGTTDNADLDIRLCNAPSHDEAIEIFAQQLMRHVAKQREISNALNIAISNKTFNQEFVDKIYSTIAQQINSTPTHEARLFEWATALHQDPWLLAEFAARGVEPSSKVTLMQRDREAALTAQLQASEANQLQVSTPTRAPSRRSPVTSSSSSGFNLFSPSTWSLSSFSPSSLASIEAEASQPGTSQPLQRK